MAEPLRLISVGAHPSDVFDTSGGTLAHHARRGDYVAGIVLTHGARVHDKKTSDETKRTGKVPAGPELLKLMAERAEVKAQEVREGCRILGFEDVFLFGLDDYVLTPTPEAIKRLARVFRELKPDVVLTHFPLEKGPFNDHSVTGQITMRAISLARTVDDTDTNPPHSVAQVFYYGQHAAWIRRDIWDSAGGFYNDVFVDITDVVELKLKACKCLVSQAYDGPYAHKWLEAGDGAFGVAVTVPYAEGFISWTAQVLDYLPVSPHRLARARMPDHDQTAGASYRLPV